MFTDLLQLVNYYVRLCFRTSDTTHLSFHDIAHTETVVNRAGEISAYYNLTEKEHFALHCAAWFHDVGYLYTSPEYHEEKSVELMRDFLHVLCSAEIVSTIEKLILATKLPPHPQSLLEQIICDADTYHFGTKDFFTSDQLVKKEFEMNGTVQFHDWDARSLQLLKSHQFFTSYCKRRLDEGKLANIAILESKVK